MGTAGCLWPFSGPSPRQILGVAKDASFSIIQTQYRKLVLQYHPAIFIDEAVKKQKVNEFHHLQQAYELLRAEDQRAREIGREAAAEFAAKMRADFSHMRSCVRIAHIGSMRLSFIDYLETLNQPSMTNTGTFLGVEGIINGTNVHALADTGADENLMNEAFCKKLLLKPVFFRPHDRPSFVMGHGRTVQAIGMVKGSWKFSADARMDTYQITFYLFPDCIFDLMIGGAFLFRTDTMTANRHRLSRMPRPRMAPGVRMVNLCGSPGRRLNGTLNNKDCSALPDSGAEPNLLSYSYAKKRGWLPNIVPGPESCRLLLFADGSTKRTEGQLKLIWSFGNRWDMASPDQKPDSVVIFDVLHGCPHDVIVGQSFLDETNAFTNHVEAFEELYRNYTSGLFLVIWACGRSTLKNIKAKLKSKYKSTSKPTEANSSTEASISEEDDLEQELQRRAEADEKTLHSKHSQNRGRTEETLETARGSHWDIEHSSSKPSSPPASSGCLSNRHSSDHFQSPRGFSPAVQHPGRPPEPFQGRQIVSSLAPTENLN